MLLAPHKQIENCLRCSRPLTNPVSMYVGFGPICSEYLGIQRPEYEELMKLNPENNEHHAKLMAARQKLEAANNIEGSITIEGQTVITKFDWDCQHFDEMLEIIKRFKPRKWNNIKKQWETDISQLQNIIRHFKKFSNIAIDEDLFSTNTPVPPPNHTKTKLESLAAQMKKRLETADITNVTLKNGLQLFLKKENNTYKVFCVRESVLPSKVEIRVIGNSFFGKGQWEFGKAKTSPPLPAEGYVIQSKSTD